MATELDRETLRLEGVPETMLWPLWNRAAEMQRKDPLIDDPISAELVKRIDYDFGRSFGAPSVTHAIRARYSDDLVRAYVEECDGQPTVISLGDGIDTQAWRVNDSRVRWVSVDVPEAIAVRRKLLPKHPKMTLVECSALSELWCPEIKVDTPPFISAAGLLMYFDEIDVVRLLAMIADWYPGATIFFDTIPPSFSRKTMRGFKVTRHYTAPPMPWGVEVDDVADFLGKIPGVSAGTVMTYADPFPDRLKLYQWLSRFQSMRKLAIGLVVAKTYRKTAAGYA